MKHLYSYKLRLNPITQQEVLLAKHFGCGRFVFNHFLNKRIQEKFAIRSQVLAKGIR